MRDIGLILEVLGLQYREFPALAGAQPNRRRHYNITFEPVERQRIASGVPISVGQTRSSKAAPVAKPHSRKRVIPDSVKKRITRDGTGAKIRMSGRA